MAIQSICSIPDCDKPPIARGWCSKHYQRWQDRGDPLWQKSPTPQGCSMPNCGGAHKTKGLCRAHYARLLRYGSPLAGSTMQGEPERYLREVVLGYVGEDCLTWPYSKFQTGYAALPRKDKRHTVSRLVCEETNGPPPSPQHYAAHSCGKGHLACVNPHHLSWKTPSENQADRVEHGTSNRGTRCGSAKLTENDVLKIRSLPGKAVDLARQYHVSDSTIREIRAKKSWGWLD